MDGIVQKAKVLFKKKGIMSLIINSIYLLAMLLFFEPFFSLDDNYMASIVYGAYSGEYSRNVIYENFIYGDIVVFFQKLFPDLPCYTLMFYLLLFISFTLLTYIILLWNDGALGWIIINIILLFWGYEGYITIQFTKVAGIIGNIGAFSILSRYSNIKIKLVGAVLFVFSCLIRENVGVMIIGGWLVALCLWWVLELYKKTPIREIGKVSLKVLCIVFIYVLVINLPMYKSEEEQNFWDEFWKGSTYRSFIQDYAVPDYQENADLFEELNISENDLYIWHSWNTDVDGYSYEKGAAIASLLPKYQASFWDRVLDKKNITLFFKTIPRELLISDVSIAYIVIMLLIIISSGWKRQWEKYVVCSIPFIILVALNYYLFLSGRYLKHRVDISIFLNMCLFVLFLISSNKIFIAKRKMNSLVVIFSIVFVIELGSWPDDRPVFTAEDMNENRLYYENVMQDSKYYYVECRTRSYDKAITIAYSPLECMPKGLYANSCLGYDLYKKSLLQEQGIGYIYEEVLNNDMYLVMADNSYDQAAWERYISERNNVEEVTFTKVKQFHDRCLYRVTTKSEEDLISVNECKEDESLIKKDIKCILNENQIEIDGYAFLDGYNDFLQNVYIQVVDSKTGKYQIYYTLQEVNELFDTNECGYYSSVETRFEKPNFFGKGDKVYLIIENGDSMYKTELSISY